ncbi:MAG: hypothetical protein HYS23_10540 [Geobacter sp.]|nr:hypothetical protein [Geobacter sp.]
MKSLAGYWLKIAAVLLLAGFSAGCGNGESTSSQTFPSSATVFYMHSVAFRNTTTTMAWGYNAFGQVGNNSTEESSTPVSTGLVGMTGMSVGSNHSLAFMNNSTVRAWGYNGYGQLGNGDNEYVPKIVPVKVVNLSGVTAVAAGGYHSLALKSGGTVWAWGSNGNGRLGTGSSDERSDDPTEVTATYTGAPLPLFTKIAAGGSHSVALASDGKVWTWGYNGDGQLGIGSTDERNKPVQVMKNATTALTDVKLIAAGGAFTVAVNTEGSVDKIWAWGYNGYGQLGQNPTTTSTSPYAVEVSGITLGATETIIAISAGADHVLAVTSDGKLWAWGLNRYGQLGDGTTTDVYTPKDITTLTSFTVDTSGLTIDGVSRIMAVGLHSLARSGGKLKAWGYNAYGQLGNGTKTTSPTSTPVNVTGY